MIKWLINYFKKLKVTYVCDWSSDCIRILPNEVIINTKWMTEKGIVKKNWRGHTIVRNFKFGGDPTLCSDPGLHVDYFQMY